MDGGLAFYSKCSDLRILFLTHFLYSIFLIHMAEKRSWWSILLLEVLSWHIIPHEPWHDKTNNMAVRPVKTQISLGIRPVWSEYLLCAQWVAKDPSFLHMDSEDSDQTGQMPRLIWVFTGRTATLLVLTCRLNYNNLCMSYSRINYWNGPRMVSKFCCTLNRLTCTITELVPRTWFKITG